MNDIYEEATRGYDVAEAAETIYSLHIGNGHTNNWGAPPDYGTGSIFTVLKKVNYR